MKKIFTKLPFLVDGCWNRRYIAKSSNGEYMIIRTADLKIAKQRATDQFIGTCRSYGVGIIVAGQWFCIEWRRMSEISDTHDGWRPDPGSIR